jgi:membrane protease YdiL (CAAX protease family)
MPKNIPLDDFFRTASDVWLVTAFGTLIAPLFEEVLFRGFLLPAFAIAYDWLSLPRTPAAREAWHSNNRLTRPALAFAAILTSICFTALHGPQTGFAWPVLILLFCVSMVLCYVRLRLRSVMASTLIHVSYNATIFLFAFAATGGYRHLEKIVH